MPDRDGRVAHRTPIVRVDLTDTTTNRALVPPTVEAPSGGGSRVGPAVIALVIASIWILFAAYRPDPPPIDPPREETMREPITEELAGIAIGPERVVVIDSPSELTSIVSEGANWLTVGDGRLMRSTDLLTWRSDGRVRSAVAVAADPSGDGVHVLVAREGFTNDGSSPLRRGAVDETGWAAIDDVGDRGPALLLNDGDSTRILDVGDVSRITALAVSGDLVLFTTDTASNTTLNFVTRSFGDALWCQFPRAGHSELVTSGDGTVHLVERHRAWVIEPGSNDLKLAIDVTAIRPETDVSVWPLATGGGWSVLSSAADRSRLYVTDDGGRFEELAFPSETGVPIRAIWANLGVDEGAGIVFSTADSGNTTIRVGDPGTRHPYPEDIRRTLQLDPPDLIEPIRGPHAQCSVIDAVPVDAPVELHTHFLPAAR
ncbi:MAG: hypothetical protein KJO18_07515 [Acidimicrobiia bacterium]|nr:hypothetical protein [Acidimicrobiia bacterium]